MFLCGHYFYGVLSAAGPVIRRRGLDLQLDA
jgi:hypothetical protein